ncbi:Hypothetical predicted protein [Xyrichtys novacula]|uniref:Uncharacterized protein n=1 Tax=Xyrichtys novacula TaxID=13765 RepID=A0AAV1F424_XYRNO|nr:Hypothetical predicted protein [Xyrichtys novacula]
MKTPVLECLITAYEAGLKVNLDNIRMHELPMEGEVLELLPGFHAPTGSDSTSYISGHTKKSCRNVFRQHSHLLKGLGEGPELSDSTIMDANVFFCKLYSANNTNNVNEVRLGMFFEGMTIKRQPPTRDALKLHIQCVDFQTLVWRQAHLQYPVLPPPEYGMEDGVRRACS